MQVFDDMGRSIRLPTTPQRIISLCPSITETICDLGAGQQLVGITSYCRHPHEQLQGIERVGGPLNPDSSRIEGLQPDLILVSKEENQKSFVDSMEKTQPIYVLDVTDFEGGLDCIKTLGQLTNHQAKASELIQSIKDHFPGAGPFSGRALYLVWNQPLMAAGKRTFIHSMLQKAGFSNAADSLSERYPNIENIIHTLDFDTLLLPSEPYTFSRAEEEALRLRFSKKTILRVDGELFCWFGSRMLLAPDYWHNLAQRIK